jgi:hypothetical protein
MVAILAGEVVARFATLAIWHAGLAAQPEIATELEFAEKTFFPRFSKEILLAEPADYPAPIWPPNGTITWTTFGELPKEAFPSPPKEEAARPGVVRIAFFGGSTTWTGYPEEVGRRLAERFGVGRVEVLNLGIPSSNSWTSLVLMRKYIPRWRPHIAVLYQGFNDQTNYIAHSLALLTEVDGSELVMSPPHVRGLWSFVSQVFARPTRTVFQDMLEEGLFGRAEDAWWEMSRLTWGEGISFFLSTFASPSYDTIPAADRSFYEAEFRYVHRWVEGGVDRYATRLAAQNAHVQEVGALAGLPVIDVASAIHGGRKIFQDNCHLNPEGRVLHSEVVAPALAETVHRLLDAGAPLPAPPVPAAVHDLPEQSSDGCLRGPCPAGACLVEAGRARLGYARTDQERFEEAFRTTLGLPPNWYDDPRPVEEWDHGAFCLDRYERSRADRAACVAASACPPYVESPEADLPASLPTFSEARALCEFFGGRIPDEREWEVGARGDDGRMLPWGDRWSGTEANLCGRECSFGLSSSPDDGAVWPSPRGDFEGASPSGLVDVAGNLAEWVESCAGDACTEVLRGGSALSPPGLLWRRPPDGLGDAAPRLRGVRCAYDASASAAN